MPQDLREIGKGVEAQSFDFCMRGISNLRMTSGPFGSLEERWTLFVKIFQLIRSERET